MNDRPDPTLPPIERRLELDAPIERVWRAITDPGELSAWFPDRAELDLRPGGDGVFTWDAHGSGAVRVEEVEEPTLLVWRWARDPGVGVDEGVSTRVEWRLTPRDGGGTVLELTESGFVRPKDREDNAGGWTHELGELVEYLDG